nr:lysosomal acid phosphatase [Quercus suber]
MSVLSLLSLALALPLAHAQSSETVLGVYMFHRHGDRTAKSTPPANLTFLGYQEVFTSGEYYRGRYIAADAPRRINGINADLVKQSQIAVSAPDDTVLQNSATGFLQGLYPPVGSGLDVETLADGTNITAPMSGYQLIPVDLVSSGSGSEDNGWLQSTTNCGEATISSNNYFASTQYQDMLASTQDFYDTIVPVVNRTFNASQVSFKNAYTIYDLIHVAEIHNASIESYADILTDDTLFQLRTLADAHEWGLAYTSETLNTRAINGMTLAGQIVEFLNGTIAGAGSEKLGIQFGAYGTFASFFGLADLPSVSPNFTGIADYASAMSFEMFTNSSTAISSTSYPSTDDIYVRFFFHNGTTSNASEPVQYPLFGSGQDALSWNDFTNGMNKFAVSSTEQWCKVCQNFTGTCAAYGRTGVSDGSSDSNSSSGGLSPAVDGVIGAMVTLAVVLGLEALILVLGGLRVVSKKRVANANASIAAGKA